MPDKAPPVKRRRFGTINDVRGCPGWYYGLRVTHKDGSVTFDVHHDDGRRIEALTASRYRTTTLARKMGERERKGYEHVAREAIRAQ
jgi:hypothetical protein